MATLSEARPLDPAQVEAQLTLTSDADPAIPVSFLANYVTADQLHERLYLSGVNTTYQNKAIDPTTGAIIAQTGSRVLLDTPVEARTVYDLNTISDLQGVYGYISQATGAFKFLSTFLNTPQELGESKSYSTTPSLPADTQDNILYLRASLHSGNPGDLYIYRTDRYAGGAAGGTVDLLGLSAAQCDEVMALTYDENNDADPAASPSWSKPGMWFRARDANGDSWKYECGRQTYVPGTAGRGQGPCWGRITLIKP